MTLHKVETIGILLCVGVMSLALFLLRTNDLGTILSSVNTDSQLAAIATPQEGSDTADLEQQLRGAINNKGEITKMVIDDVVAGVGNEVKAGDTVSVHYIGTLQNGQQFDNSHTRGEAFTFTVGEGMVIKGWDEGLLGMKVGGQRLLVIPPDMAYGANAIGPIPANSTLLFSIELIEIK
jgi:FKBP-type peptidyl-prolyl cis-trans isomerase